LHTGDYYYDDLRPTVHKLIIDNTSQIVDRA
jgi:hypothetical protein